MRLFGNLLTKNARKKVVLVVLDGLGVAPPGPGNAVTLANTPNLDKYWQNYPHGTLKAFGKFVGLPQDADGNSEVGHLTMGAGKVVLQDLPRIDNAIQTGSFFKNDQFLKAIEHAKNNAGAIHLLGLVGNGLVHSDLNHLFALIDLLDQQSFDPDKVSLHAFLDGRDSSPDAGARVLERIDKYMDSKRLGKIASFVGRAFAKDRDERWDRTKKAYEIITLGKGKKVGNYKVALEKYYKRGKSDEYIEPHVIVGVNRDKNTVSRGDSVISFDFRPDRAVQLTKAFVQEDFQGFDRKRIEDLYFVGMTEYAEGIPENVAFPSEQISRTLGQVLSINKKSQLRIAESEKFPHVTFFFDGENNLVYEGVDQVEVPSNRKVTTYDQMPEMRSVEIADNYIKFDNKKDYDFALINFAAPDMVAHTGNLQASIKAIETVDRELGRVVDHAQKKGAIVLLTSDHGNCEELINTRTGEVDTKHSSNDVPLIAIGKGLKKREFEYGSLVDVAPIVLAHLGIEKPIEMEGQDLLSAL
ncbi:2,3-bisphosphoglycerate-independent phosphoglycerate mutase [Candidatus Dojkabacteria bacterium]|nr:2,3-bisphosphoglycerate-independent phosphoglycerate mutase [Candidatus Dojkabacteria bacterium]